MTRGLTAPALLVLLAGYAFAPGPVLAEELPPEIAAVDTADDAAVEEALRALATHEEREALVMGVLLDDEALAQLSPEAQARLMHMAGTEDMRFSGMVLRRALRQDGTPEVVRRAAVSALAVAGGIADVSVLGDALAEFPEIAADGLRRIGGVPARLALRRGGGDDPHHAVLLALLELGETDVAEVLVDRLAESEGEQRTSIAAGLAAVTGREHGDSVEAWRAWARQGSLAAELAEEDYDTVVATTDELLARIRGGDAEQLVADLRAILLDDSAHVFARDRAALLLGLGGVTAARQDLLAAAANKQPGSTRLYAAEALARVGDLSVVVPLVKMLVHDEDRDRLQAKRGRSGEYFPVDPAFVRTLHRLGVQGAFEPVIPLLAGTYRTRMHRDCLRALREIHPGDPFGYEPDSAQEERDAALVRMRAWWVHGRERLGIRPAADATGREAMEAEIGELVAKLGAFKFLHQLRAKRALIILAELAQPQLEEALAHENLHVRMGATEVLAGARLRAATPALAARLSVEENPAALTKVLAALVVCGRCDVEGRPAADAATTAKLREDVLRLLTHPAHEVRLAAVEALGVVGRPRVATPLIHQALEDPANDMPTFRALASGALLRLASRAALPPLLDELVCDDLARREEAATALRSAGLELGDYDPDLPDDELHGVVDRLRTLIFAPTGGAVSHGGRR